MDAVGCAGMTSTARSIADANADESGLLRAGPAPVAAAPMLKIESLFKSFNVRDPNVTAKGISRLRVLDDINLDVAKGEFISLLGASGCGKTTLLRLIAGLIRPDRGAIFVGSEVVQAPRKDLCMVFQNFGLLPWRLVLDNVAFPLEIDGMGRTQREAVAASYIKLVGLSGFERNFPHELSGGMQQRVGIARALVRKPLILLMDEPFAALDAQTREQMQDEFLEIWSALKTTVIFVTHAIDEALLLSDRVVVLHSRPGRINRIIISPVAPHRMKEDVRARPEFARQAHEIRELLRPERTV
jgi:NitT/TauT family transport system ATP-binding protein